MKYYIIDDNHEMRELWRLLLKDALPSLELAGFSDNGEEALNDIQELCPELVIVSFSLPDINGIETIRRIKPLIKACNPKWFLITLARKTDEFNNLAKGAGVDEVIPMADPSLLAQKATDLISL